MSLYDYIGKTIQQDSKDYTKTSEFNCKKCGDKTEGNEGSLKLKLKLCSKCIVNDWEKIKKDQGIK